MLAVVSGWSGTTDQNPEMFCQLRANVALPRLQLAVLPDLVRYYRQCICSGRQEEILLLVLDVLMFFLLGPAMMKQQMKVFLVLLPNTQNHRGTTEVALSISPFLVLDDNTRISGDPKHTI